MLLLYLGMYAMILGISDYHELSDIAPGNLVVTSAKTYTSKKYKVGLVYHTKSVDGRHVLYLKHFPTTV